MNINSMGVVIAKLCPCPTKPNKLIRVEQVIKIKLEIQLKEIINPRVDDQYTLFLFASSDIQQQPELNKYISLPPNKIIKTSFCLTIYPNLPYKLHTWLFVTCKDIDGLKTQTLLATGEIKMKQLLYNLNSNPITLKDIKTNTQANITILCPNATKLKYINIDHSKDIVDLNRDELRLGNTNPMHPVAKRYLDQIYNVYNQVKHEHYQKFAYIDTHCGRIPLLAFPILATKIRPSATTGSTLLERLLNYSCLNMGLNVNYLVSQSLNIKMEIICEMLTLIPRMLLYELDYIRTGSAINKITNCDQWTKLGVFPTLGLAAFDCEDGAELILELFHVFKYTQLDTNKSPVLFHLQQLLNSYTPFLCLGLLNDSNVNLTPHAYVILLDSNYVNHQILHYPNITTNYSPTCILESTNYTQSVWNLSDSTTQEEELQEYDTTAEEIPIKSLNRQDNKWQRMIKFKMPLAVIKKENMYNTITAILTADHHTPDHKTVSFHVLLSDQVTSELGVSITDEKLNDEITSKLGFGDSKSNNEIRSQLGVFQVGCQIESLISHSYTVRSKILIELSSHAESQEFEQLLVEFPPSSLPKPSHYKSYPVISNKKPPPRYVLRKYDFETHRSNFTVNNFSYDCIINPNLNTVLL